MTVEKLGKWLFVFTAIIGSAGCSEVPVFALGGELAEEQITRAMELGLPIYLSDDRESQIGVAVVEDLAAVTPSGSDPDKIEGYSAARYGCRRFVFITPRAKPNTAAHEIGHLLGLRHVDNPSNLMHHSGAGNELTDKQLGKLERVADRLANCPS